MQVGEFFREAKVGLLLVTGCWSLFICCLLLLTKTNSRPTINCQLSTLKGQQEFRNIYFISLVEIKLVLSLHPQNEGLTKKETKKMANHKSALKRIRQTEKRRNHNRFYGKTMRNAVRKFRALDDKKAAEEQLPGIMSLIDSLSKKSIIHKNKAANLKSKLTKHVNSM